MERKEQRAYQRYEYHTPIAFGFAGAEMISRGETKNYGMGGMCFETNFALPKGTEIRILMEKYDPKEKGPESRKIYRAEVRWCRDFHAGKYRFQSGVNYFEPILY